MKLLMTYLCSGLLVFSLLSGCSLKNTAKDNYNHDFMAIGGIEISSETGVISSLNDKNKLEMTFGKDGTRNMYSVMKLYGVKAKDPIKTRIALQSFLQENPSVYIQHIATMLCDQKPLVFIWAIDDNNRKKFVHLELLKADLVDTDNYQTKNASEIKETLIKCKNKYNNEKFISHQSEMLKYLKKNNQGN